MKKAFRFFLSALGIIFIAFAIVLVLSDADAYSPIEVLVYLAGALGLAGVGAFILGMARPGDKPDKRL